MKRTVGVTATSVCVIAASAAFCVYEGWSLVSEATRHRQGFGVLALLWICALVFGAWGVVSGIGVLRLRRWAWLCVLVISALLILVNIPGLLGAPKLIRATTGVPTVSAGNFVSHQYFHLIWLTLVPFALGLWWLLFFTRRGVRLQFASAAPAFAIEGNFIPARSDAVTASGIILLFGSALVLLGAVIMPLTAFEAPQTQPEIPFRGMLVVVGVMYALVAAWGVVTAIGVLKRRSWARILMIVTAACGAGFALLGSAGALMGMMITASKEQISSSAMHVAAVAMAGIVLVPLGISVWWLVLFTRPRIALEFASPSAAPGFPLAEVPAAPLPMSVQMQPEIAPVPAAAPLRLAAPAMPLSIRIVAVLEILFGVLALFAPLNAKIMGAKVPTLIFGFVVHGWGVNVFYIVCGVAPILFGAAILWRKAWALDAMIAFLLAQIANFASRFVSPERARFDAELQTQMQSFTARIKLPDGSAPPPSPIFAHMNVFYDVTFAVSIVLYAALLYFLFTRRRGFRSACSHGPAGGSGAPLSSATDEGIAR